VKSRIPFFEETGTWKRHPAPEGHDTFVCIGCGAQVRRPWPSGPFDELDVPGRPWDDNFKCLNCTFGNPS
jgi:hypothetical protein